ncbi:hypothetical protein [Helicobacter suis]|nr:hypothetical protein [Helicobacter suis]
MQALEEIRNIYELQKREKGVSNGSTNLFLACAALTLVSDLLL